LGKAVDDMLLSTPKGPILRSDRHELKKSGDTDMLPPRERKGKMKKISRKKRLEKLLESKKKRQNVN
jgi:hypothetical protein